MQLRTDLFPFASTIENIIFDFGGVICDIDPKLAEKQFLELGFNVADSSALPKSKELVHLLESGAIQPRVFRDGFRELFVHPPTDEQIDFAWNALLLDIREPRIRCLEALRDHYRIFLLSNTNEIHYNCYVARFREKYGYRDFDQLFEKAWFSYRIGITKPDVQVFHYVLNDKNLAPEKTLFIDDTLVHVEGGAKAGLHGFHLEPQTEINDLFVK